MFPNNAWKLVPRAEWEPVYSKCRAWDLASTGGAGDYTVGSLMGRSARGDFYVFGRERRQCSSSEGIALVNTIAQQDTAAVPILIEEEKGASGKNLVEFYRKELPGYAVSGSPVNGTKEMRATPYSILQQGGNVILPADDADAEWVAEWIKEHSGMMGDGRRPKHDDQIDTAAHAVNYLLEHGVVEVADPHEMPLHEMMEFLEEMGVIV